LATPLLLPDTMSSTQPTPTPQHGEAAPRVMGPPILHQQTVPSNSYIQTLYQARGPPGLRTLAAAPTDQLPPSHQPALGGPSQSVPPIPANLGRKRKAPTLRPADWEPMKKRITELWTSDEKYTIPRLEEALRLEFAFTAT
jgi:hypothetical protein